MLFFQANDAERQASRRDQRRASAEAVVDNGPGENGFDRWMTESAAKYVAMSAGSISVVGASGTGLARRSRDTSFA